MGESEPKKKSVILDSKSMQKAILTMLDPGFYFNNIGLYFEVANEIFIEEFKKSKRSPKASNDFEDKILKIIAKLVKENRVNEHFYKGK